jgi:iron complex transport system ATP-binding protein
MRLLGRLARTTENAVLLATHDLDLALRSADRIWLLPRGGPLQVGAPEDLILSGAFESVFATEGVAFDRADGSFRLHRAYHSVVTLVGTGEAAIWTRRALDRAGFRIDADGRDTPLRVEVQSGAGPRWHVTGASAPFTCDSLYELILRLRGAKVPVAGG